MDATSQRISKVFTNGGDILYLLPYFQREYAWDKSNWQTILKDIFSIYEIYQENEPPEHFLGALVVISDGMTNGVIPRFQLVDGQQRLTTISLILCALADLVAESNTSLHRKIQRMLMNQDEKGLIRFKLLPTTKYGDRDAYTAILENKPIPAKLGSKIPDAYRYIKGELSQKLGSNVDPEQFFIVLTNCMQVVFINLDRKERPYEIFESLNAKGRPLTQADLVRNYIAMKLPASKQEEAFNEYWSTIESLLQEKRIVGKSRLGELTAFLRHYLALRSGILCNEEHVYARFRDRIELEFSSADAFIAELANLKQFATYYDCLLRPEHEQNSAIREALQRLNIFEMTTAFPFLLDCYAHGALGELTHEQFLDGLSVLENYIVRRYLAGEPSNYLNKIFPVLSRDISWRNFGESLRQALLAKNYPANSRVQRGILEEAFYDQRTQTQKKLCFILGAVNDYLSKDSGGTTVLHGDPTIEHIMPQTLTDAWKQALGDQWAEIHNDYLDTLGNLTLVNQEWNSVLSNASFTIKKPKLASHALKLNAEYFSHDVEQWNNNAIQERAAFLAATILAIWPALIEFVPSANGSSSTPPTAIVIDGNRFSAGTWKEAAIQLAEYVTKHVDNFETAIQDASSYFRLDNPSNNNFRQLSNGWWMYTTLSQAAVRRLCKKLTLSISLTDEDWSFEFN